MDFLKINGVPMPTPAECTIDEYDLDAPSSGRPESGYMHRDRVRHDVMRLQLEWKDLTAAQAALLRAALAPTSVAVEIYLFDGVVARMMYAGDRHWTERFDSSKTAHVGLKCDLSEN